MRPFFKDEVFNFQTEIALGATYHQAADVGEVLATVERIRNGHAQSWVDEWSVTADRLAAEATASADAGHSHSAARQFLRVSMYYSLASYAADGTGDSTLFAKLWEMHRAAWDRFVDLTDVQIERIEIPYEHDAARLLLPLRPGGRAAANAHLQQRQRRAGDRRLGPGASPTPWTAAGTR